MTFSPSNAINSTVVALAQNVGRPTKYHYKLCKPARKLSELGATESEIAEYLDISVSTLEDYKKLHPEFAKAIKEPKENVDNQVVQSLFKRATGFSKMVKVVGFSKDGEMIQGEEEKYFPPSEVACIFWLKNRRPKEWRDKFDATVSNPDGSNLLDSLIIGIAQKLALQQSQPKVIENIVDVETINQKDK